MQDNVVYQRGQQSQGIAAIGKAIAGRLFTLAHGQRLGCLLEIFPVPAWFRVEQSSGVKGGFVKEDEAGVGPEGQAHLYPGGPAGVHDTRPEIGGIKGGVAGHERRQVKKSGRRVSCGWLPFQQNQVG